MKSKSGRGVIVEMIKNKEKIIEDCNEKIIEIITSYVEGMDSLSETDEFTVDNIEARWGELEEYMKQIYTEVNKEIIQQLNERNIIRSKKLNTKRKA